MIAVFLYTRRQLSVSNVTIVSRLNNSKRNPFFTTKHDKLQGLMFIDLFEVFLAILTDTINND